MSGASKFESIYGPDSKMGKHEAVFSMKYRVFHTRDVNQIAKYWHYDHDSKKYFLKKTYAEESLGYIVHLPMERFAVYQI